MISRRRALRFVGRPLVLATLLAIVALVYGTLSMSRYGVTFDSPSLFYAGDRTLFWAQHRDIENALDVDQVREPLGFVPAFQRSPEATDPIHYPVFPGLVCAITSRIFHDRLHWVDLVDGHHLGLVLLHCVGLLLFCFYLSQLLGRVAGVAGTIALATFPCALASSFNNAKDWPCALYYSVAILAAGVGVIRMRGRTLLFAGFLLGISFACKLQALFALPTLALWAPIAYMLLFWRRKRVSPSVVGGFLAGPYIAAMTFFVSWPWLYHGKKLYEWWDHLAEYLRFMVHYGISERETWTMYPVRTLLYMSPPIVLVAAAGYLLVGWRRLGHQSERERCAIWVLFALWFAIPIIRTARPHSAFYGSNRHYVEYVPALCAMAGGFTTMVVRAIASAVRRWPVPRAAVVGASGGLAAAALVCLVLPILAYRPYELMYFNSLAGGLGGAQANALLFVPKTVTKDGHKEHNASGAEGDFWFTSVRDALRHARAYMPPAGGSIGFCGPWVAQVRANTEDVALDIHAGDPRALRDVPIVYVAPVGNVDACTYFMAREFERERPVLWRVVREGGLIFEVLGAPDGNVHPVTTPPNAYDKLMGT